MTKAVTLYIMKCTVQRIGEDMILDLVGLLGGAELSIPFNCSIKADGLSPDIMSGTANAEGNIRNFSGYILLNADIKLKAQVICARCGNDFDTVFSFSTEQKLTNKLENQENDEFLIIENGSFDITEYVSESILLELPSKFICKDDCKGLCLKCGKNLNDSLCSCDKRDIDPRLAVLSDYFKEK